MTDTEIRQTLLLLSEAVPVPAPDRTRFESRVRRERRRRTAARSTAACLTVAAVTVGAALVASGHDAGQDVGRPADPPPSVTTPDIPVLVRGRLTELAAGGSLGQPGPRVARIVGPVDDGVLVFAMDGSLATVTPDGDVHTFVDEPVRRAYVDDDGVVYQTYDGLVHFSAADRDTRSAQDEGGMLVAADQGTYVVAGDSGLMAHDRAGVYELFVDTEESGQVVQQVEIGGDRIAVHLQGGVQIFENRGLRAGGLPEGSTGALAPDGSVYAMAPDGAELDDGAPRGLRLLEPRSLAEGERIPGPDGAAVDLAWTDPDTLLVLTDEGATRTLWRCTDGGTTCAVLLADTTGTLRLQ